MVTTNNPRHKSRVLPIEDIIDGIPLKAEALSKEGVLLNLHEKRNSIEIAPQGKNTTDVDNSADESANPSWGSTKLRQYGVK
jgi:hypothetical protein